MKHNKSKQRIFDESLCASCANCEGFEYREFTGDIGILCSVAKSRLRERKASKCVSYARSKIECMMETMIRAKLRNKCGIILESQITIYCKYRHSRGTNGIRECFCKRPDIKCGWRMQ